MGVPGVTTKGTVHVYVVLFSLHTTWEGCSVEHKEYAFASQFYMCIPVGAVALEDGLCIFKHNCLTLELLQLFLVSITHNRQCLAEGRRWHRNALNWLLLHIIGYGWTSCIAQYFCTRYFFFFPTWVFSHISIKAELGYSLCQELWNGKRQRRENTPIFLVSF